MRSSEPSGLGSVGGLRVASVATLVAMLFPVPNLVSHVSSTQPVLGRFSFSYFGFLLVYAGALLLPAAGAALPARTWAGAGTKVARALRGKRIVGLWWLPLVGLGAGLWILARLGQRNELTQAPSLQVAGGIFWAWCIYVLCNLSGSIRAVAAMLVLCRSVAVVLFALVLGEVFLRLRPDAVPTAVMLSLPGGGRYLRESAYQLEVPIRVGYRFAPLVDTWIEFDPYDPFLDGLDGLVGPYGEEGEPLRLRFVTDENGFLNVPPVEGSIFPIILAGDSFLGLTAHDHWPDMLRETTGAAVLNLSMPGWGTQSEVEAIRLFGLDKNPEWVVIMYFEGNDLWDAHRYEDKQSSGLDWLEHDVETAGPWESLVVPHLVDYGISLARDVVLPRDNTYPLDLRIGNQSLRLAFSSQYVGVLGACAEVIGPSRNLLDVENALLEARDTVAAQGARLVLVYVPSEEHIYLPFVAEPRQRERIMRGVPLIELDQEGYLQMVAAPVSWAQVASCMDDQMELLDSFARQHEIGLLNLTPCFEREASGGVVLYNYSDTHWNDAGHELAASAVARYMDGEPQPCP